MKRLTFLFLIIGMLIIVGCSSATSSTSPSNKNSNGLEVTVFKSPSCGCCVGYASELEDSGYNVKTIPTQDMDSIKKQHNIPMQMESCHTSIVGDYFVEGHVPIEIVEQLLVEKPNIDGIALPGMPSGSPGMPGAKRGQWTIYGITDGVATPYKTI
jgi:hypothetical protein